MVISRLEMLDPYYYINEVRQFSKHSFEVKIQALDTITQDLQEISFNDDRRPNAKVENPTHPEKRSCRNFCSNEIRYALEVFFARRNPLDDAMAEAETLLKMKKNWI